MPNAIPPDRLRAVLGRHRAPVVCSTGPAPGHLVPAGLADAGGAHRQLLEVRWGGRRLPGTLVRVRDYRPHYQVRRNTHCSLLAPDDLRPQGLAL